MDYTLDDTAPQLVYSQDGWLVQSSNDTARSLFFNGTYHTVQVDGATVNVTVAGSSSISIYGSTGPGHSNYSVQVDDSIAIRSAYAPKPQFQQVLFTQTLDPSVSHFVSLRAIHSLNGNWLDIDYVSFISGNFSPDGSSNAATNTITPPWAGVVSTPSLAGAVGVGESPSHPGHNVATTVLAILLGLLLTAIASFSVFYFRRRHAARQKRKTPSNMWANGRPVIGPPTNFEHKVRGGQLTKAQIDLVERAPTIASSILSMDQLKGPGYLDAATALPYMEELPPPVRFSPPPSPGFRSIASSLTLQARSGTHQRLLDDDPLKSSIYPAPPSQRTGSFLGNVPGLTPRARKGDADSIKTDFLQV